MRRPHQPAARAATSGAARARRPRVARPPRPTAAERRLLALAREITGLPLGTALETLAAAWGPGATLPRDVALAFLKGRGDKTASLALAWAREQVRLALQEAIAAGPTPTRRRVDAAPETLAWLLLAACASLAHEPPSAVAERVSAILDLGGLGGTGQ